TAAREAAATQALTAERERLGGLEATWATEKDVVERILALRSRLREGLGRVEGTASELEDSANEETAQRTAQADAAAVAGTAASLGDAERAALLDELKALQAELADLQGEAPLILPSVDQQAVASVVQDWTGIPVGRMVRNEIETVLNLAGALGKRVIGQDHALEMIAKRIKTSRANLDNPGKPIGVFM